MQEHAFLREEIEQAIAQEPRITGSITVELRGRDVRLTGIVNSLEERELAEEVAREFGPVRIDNDIVIESTKVIDDHDVLASAKRAIARDPDLAHDIGVDRVVGGVAYLKGHSASLSGISNAAEIVAEAPGVKDVVSEVKIKTDVLITDVDLVDEVMQALSVDPAIHAEFIDVRAKDGVVTIEGTVDSLKQKTEAGNIAKTMPGVTGVVNNLNMNQLPSSLDQAVENQVIKALELSEINMNSVRVNVLDGVVHLDGTVDTYRQKDLAERTARKVPDVRYVQNDLVIGFHIEPKAG